MTNRLTRRSILHSASALTLATALQAFPRARLVCAQGDAAYDLIDLGPWEFIVPGTLSTGSILAMTDDGNMCGWVGVSETRGSPATWSASGKLKRLKSGKGGGRAGNLNRAGQVVGVEYVDPADRSDSRPILWQGNERIQLPGLDGSVDTVRGVASDVNDDGVIVGYLRAGDDEPNIAVRWIDGVAEQLPDPPGGRAASTSCINEQGTILGRVILNDAKADDKPPFALWRGDEITILPFPVEVTDIKKLYIGAQGLNNRDVALFSAADTTDIDHWFYFTIDGDEITVVDAREDDLSYAGIDLNDQGDVLQSMSGGGKSLDSLVHDGEEIDIPTLIPTDSGLTFRHAGAINNVGMIAGDAVNGDGVIHGILLVPRG